MLAATGDWWGKLSATARSNTTLNRDLVRKTTSAALLDHKYTKRYTRCSSSIPFGILGALVVETYALVSVMLLSQVCGAGNAIRNNCYLVYCWSIVFDR